MKSLESMAKLMFGIFVRNTLEFAWLPCFFVFFHVASPSASHLSIAFHVFPIFGSRGRSESVGGPSSPVDALAVWVSPVLLSCAWPGAGAPREKQLQRLNKDHGKVDQNAQ